MATVSIRDVTHGKHVMRRLPEAFHSADHSDVTFYCRNGQVRAHRLLLAAVSPFLKTLFLEQGLRDVVEVSLPDVNVDDLDNVIRYCYEGLIRLEAMEEAMFRQVQTMLGLHTAEEESEVELIRQGKKRELENKEEPPRKIPKNSSHEKIEVINTINNIIETLSPQTTSSTPASDPQPASKKMPLVVPVKHLPAVLNFIVEVKASSAAKKLEALVEQVVKQQLLKLKKGVKISSLNPQSHDKPERSESRQMPQSPISGPLTLNVLGTSRTYNRPSLGKPPTTEAVVGR